MQNKLIKIARQLRKNQTPQEAILWYCLRGNRFEGFKFRRQHPIGRYVVDFCCFEEKFIIELDGGGHNEDKKIKDDKIRDKYLKEQGYRIFRIWNNEIDDNLDGVLEKIIEVLKN
ncbi:MAG: DUF559 domain-containing protein [Patescibacteria group bacterium]